MQEFFFQLIDSFENKAGKGVPIGNLSSQYLANHYLGKADHFAKEELGVKGYVRYMDDMVLWGNDKAILLEQMRKFTHFLEHVLLCEMKTPVINAVSRGLPFLGYVVFQGKVHLASRSRRRFARKARANYMALASGRMDQAEFQAKMLPLLAFTQKADSWHFRKKIIGTLEKAYILD